MPAKKTPVPPPRRPLGPCILLLGLLSTSVAWSQQAGVQISVSRASTGAALADRIVTADNPALGVKLSKRTDDYGQARFDNLATTGSWIVATPAVGNDQASSTRPLELRANFVRTVVLVVDSTNADAGLTEIAVIAKRTVTGINTVNAEVSSTLDERALAALPIEGRDVIRALTRLPNVVPSTGFFPEAPVISINGANALFVNYSLDGLDNNENFLGGPKFPTPLGAVRDVTVLANNYSVEFGRTANGVVNYTSRGGTNEWSGETFALVRPGRPFDAESQFAGRDLSGNAVGDSFERRQFGVSIGGPISLDRTFVHFNVESIRDRNEQLLDSPLLATPVNVTGNNQFLLSSIRLDHRFNERWQFTSRANHGRVSIERPGGALGGGNVQFPSAGSDQDRISSLAAALLSYEGDRWRYQGSLQWSRFDWNYATPRAAGPQVTALGPTGVPIAIVGNPGFVFADDERSWQTKHLATVELGKHRVRAGIDMLSADFALRGGGNPAGNYTVALTPAEVAQLRSRNLGTGLGSADILGLNPTVVDYAVELRPSEFGKRQTLTAVFLEDEWRLRPDLTVTTGVRYDYDSLTELGDGSGDTNNLAPRLAVNWQPNERSVLRAGAGLFYDKLLYAVASDALQRNTTSAGLRSQLQSLIMSGILPADTDLDRVTFDGNLTVNPACAGAVVAGCPDAASVQALRATATANEIRILNPNGYENPRSLQLSAGYQYQFANQLSGSVDLIYNRTRNLVRLADLNAPSAFAPNSAALTAANITALRAIADPAARLALAEQLGLARSQDAADATRPTIAVAGEIPAGGARQITVSDTNGRSTYRALNLQLNKDRGTDRYGLRLSYTLSKLENDTDDINFRASNANDFDADRGPSANDRRHVLSAVGFFYPLAGLTVTAAGLFQSGQPINFVPDAAIFGSQDLNGDGRSFGENFVGNSDRYPGLSRNAGRLPWSKTVDLGLRYDWRLAGQTVQLSADVFNVFDWNNLSGFANAATTSNQIQFGGDAAFIQRNAGPPRQFQFGMAWQF
ncbi:MAG: TonB-dependent receptor [Proteobacteria bacterium]|nr:TonB-dependent receptor [Pseudomonadota bacterium]